MGLPQGLTFFVKQGVRFFATKVAATYVGIRAAAIPATNIDILLPTVTPAQSTDQILIFNGTTAAGYQARFANVPTVGGGGTLTDVSIDVSGAAPLTVVKSGTTALAFTIGLSNAAAAGSVFAAPAGATGAPSMRALVASDIPLLSAARIADFATVAQSYRLDQFAVPTNDLNINSRKLTGVAEPTNLQDAATKNYVDAVASSQNNKGTAWVATTSNLNLSAPGGVIDGVSLSNPGGALVLVKDQANQTQNGLWIWNGAASPMTRATNADTTAEVRTGMQIFVAEGTINNLTSWRLVSAGIIVPGTSNQVFTQDAGLAQLLAGSGMTKTGNQIDVIGTLDRITVNADNIDIASTYAGQASITTLGNITTGTWNGTAIAVARGGTGASTAKAARTNLDSCGIRRGTFTNANLTGGMLTVAHNLDLVGVPNFTCLIMIIDDLGEMQGGTDGVIYTNKDIATVDMNYALVAGSLPGTTWSWIAFG